MDDIDRFLYEDLQDKGDITSDSLFDNEISKANIISKNDCIIAGLEESIIIFDKTGASTKLFTQDGNYIQEKFVVAEISGPIVSILKGERLALNFLSRMSGIATETKKLVDKCKKINPKVTIASTRKTTPGFRKYEKKAVILGGGESHRYGLYDEVLIKDNHIKNFSSIEYIINKIKKNNLGKKIEIEIENEQDACIAAKLGVDVIMLDNFDAKNAEIVAKKIRKINKNILIEISGGINSNNILEYASFADRISLGYITQSIKAKDFSLEFL
jgi:nicotinate-nucleotide pyrophosphorylase (carboxylating)